jgi:hypothetical protein
MYPQCRTSKTGCSDAGVRDMPGARFARRSSRDNGKIWFKFEGNGDTAAVAKGETVSFHWVFRSVYPVKNLKIEAGDLTNGNHRIPANLKAFVGYVKAPYNCHTCGGGQLPTRDFYDPVSDLFPDPLLDIETVGVVSMYNQPVRVSYAVPRNASGGVYTAEVTLSTCTGSIRRTGIS